MGVADKALSFEIVVYEPGTTVSLVTLFSFTAPSLRSLIGKPPNVYLPSFRMQGGDRMLITKRPVPFIRPQRGICAFKSERHHNRGEMLLEGRRNDNVETRRLPVFTVLELESLPRDRGEPIQDLYLWLSQLKLFLEKIYLRPLGVPWGLAPRVSEGG